jgi:hypothetical protein
MKENLYPFNKLIKQFWLFIKRFWLLALISLAFILAAYWVIRNILFPQFLSGACVGQTNCDWQLLEGYVGMITLALLVGGLVFTVWEYSRQESQISFQIYEAIHKKLTDPAEEAARRWIINEITVFEDEKELTKEQWIEKISKAILERPEDWDENLAPGHKNVKMTLNTLDYVGFISQNYVNVEGPLLEWMSSPIAKVWERLKPYIEHERLEKNEPDYYQAAYHIGEKCLTWRQKKGMKSAIMQDGI